MKKLMISIQPQHVVNILNGAKTYEIRTKVLNWVLEALDRGESVECVIYCTKGKPLLVNDYRREKVNEVDYEVVNNFRLVKSTDYLPIYNGFVVASVVIDGYETYYLERPLNLEVTYRGAKNEHGCEYSKKIKSELLKKSCLTFSEIFDYGKKRFDNQQSVVYALHLTHLNIFEEPKGLGEYMTTTIPDNAIFNNDMGGNEYFYYKDTPAWHFYFSRLSRPPQSMMTVWEKEK